MLCSRWLCGVVYVLSDAAELSPSAIMVSHSCVAAAGASASDLFTAVQAKGSGYAMSTDAELQFTLDTAQQTGLPPLIGHHGCPCLRCLLRTQDRLPGVVPWETVSSSL
jgi:hypothetical protein